MLWQQRQTTTTTTTTTMGRWGEKCGEEDEEE
jgi:hypothetical protein